MIDLGHEWQEKYENVQEIGDNSTGYLAAAGWENRKVILHSWTFSGRSTGSGFGKTPKVRILILSELQF